MTTPTHGLRHAIGRTIAPPRFLAVLVLLPLAAWSDHRLVPGTPWTTALAIGFDLAALVFLGSLLPLLREDDATAIRCRADATSANRLLVLVVTTVLMLVVMAAIAGELPAARHGDSHAAALLVLTLLLTWAFANSVFALHYAHEFYTPHPHGSGGGQDGAERAHADRGGLDFPATPEPAYLDFAYFAFTLGMTFQTSDVAVTGRRMRAVAILHSFAAFVFNIGVIAFTINGLVGAAS